MTDKEEKHLTQLRTHSAETDKLKGYAIQRIDLLIISVSGASIYLSLEIMKYMHEANLAWSNWPFKLAGLLFVLSIVTNFLGQWAAHNSSHHMKCSTDAEIYWRQYHGGADLQKPSTIAMHDQKFTNYTKYVSWANVTCTSCMLAGLFVLIFAVLIIF